MIGDRIKQARLMKGASQEEVVAQVLAEGGELTLEELSELENNRGRPSASVLMDLAPVLHVRPGYFIQERGVNVTWVAFRKTAALTPTQADRIQAFARDRAEKQAWLQMQLYPDERPSFPKPIPVRTAQDAERAAEYLRQEWHLGDDPIESVAQAFEDHGGILLFWEQDQGLFDGLSGWANETIPIAVVHNGAALNRRRFNLAHELGHMVMCCDDLPDEEQEKLAHRFAAAFLVPAKTATRDLGYKRNNINLEELAILREIHGLSIKSWIMRARELEIIDQSLANDLFKSMREKGYSRQESKEPLGDEDQRRLKLMTLRALSENIISYEMAFDFCPGCIDPDELQASSPPPGRKYSAGDLMRLPAEERDKYLAEILPDAILAYTTDEDLNCFDSWDEFIEDY